MAGVLFEDAWSSVYAIFDGASIERLPVVLWEHRPEHVCLFAGEVEPDLAEVAPYLVRLEAGSDFAGWAAGQWGRHSGVFFQAPATLPFIELRKHFRKFLRVQTPEGKSVYFRYYDPRVLRSYLPTCNPQELAMVFGPVTAYAAESADPASALWFRRRADGSLDVETMPASQAVGVVAR